MTEREPATNMDDIADEHVKFILAAVIAKMGWEIFRVQVPGFEGSYYDVREKRK